MKLGSLRVRVGEQVRRGQVIGQVGYAGNSDEPHRIFRWGAVGRHRVGLV